MMLQAVFFGMSFTAAGMILYMLLGPVSEAQLRKDFDLIYDIRSLQIEMARIDNRVNNIEREHEKQFGEKLLPRLVQIEFLVSIIKWLTGALTTVVTGLLLMVLGERIKRNLTK